MLSSFHFQYFQTFAASIGHDFDDRARINALVDVEGDGGAAEVWGVSAGLAQAGVGVGVGRDQADGRVVDALFVLVFVGFDGA